MISLKGSPPEDMMPGYNPVYWYFDSTNKTDEGFRYFIEVKDPVTNEVLFTKSIMPDFKDGYGIVQLDRELSDFVSYDLHLDKPNGTTPHHASKSYLKYKIEVGEEYFEEILDGEFIFNRVAGYQHNGIRTFAFWNYNVGPIDPADMPVFQEGDTIIVEYDDPADELLYPGTAGTQTVRLIGDYAMPDKIAVVTNKAWPLLAAQNSSGTLYYSKSESKKRKRYKNLYTSTGTTGIFNGVLSIAGWRQYDMKDYLMHVTNIQERNFLSVLPRSYKIRLGNNLFVNYLKMDLTSTAPAKLRFTNNLGTVRELSFSPNATEWVNQINIGTTRTNFGTHVSGPNTVMITQNTTYYDVDLLPATGISKHFNKPYRIYIDRSCPPDSEYIEMLFLDKLGSFLPYNFLFKHSETHKITSEEYKKTIGGKTSSDIFDYDPAEGGLTTYNGSYSREFNLKTGFLNEAETRFFHNVVESPVTIIKVDGVFQRCQMRTKSVEIHKNRGLDRRQYNITVLLSNSDKINI